MILPYKNPEDAKKWSLEYSRRPEVKERTKKVKKMLDLDMKNKGKKPFRDSFLTQKGTEWVNY